MGKMEKTLREEIQRLARREIRRELAPLKADLKKLKQNNRQLKKKVKPLAKEVAKRKEAKAEQLSELSAPAKEVKAARITSGWIKNLRKKLGVSQGDLALLMNISASAVQSWEQGRSLPQGQNRVSLVALRKLGRRDVKKMLKETAPEEKKQ
jgi:DNA-binding transcriptional regulator YiaG